MEGTGDMFGTKRAASFFWCVGLVGYALGTLRCCQCIGPIEGFRLLQYESIQTSVGAGSTTTKLGCWRGAFSGVVTTLASSRRHDDYSRKVVLAMLEELTVQTLRSILNSKAMALIIIIAQSQVAPHSAGNSVPVPVSTSFNTDTSDNKNPTSPVRLSSNIPICGAAFQGTVPDVTTAYPLSGEMEEGHRTFRGTIHDVERLLLNSRTNLAVYFTLEQPQIMSLYKDQATSFDPEAGSSSFGGSLAGFIGSQVTLSARPVSDPVRIHSIDGENFYGWVSGRQKGVPTGSLPTLAFVTYYDSFAPAPLLARGAHGNASGVIASLELARLFSLLSANARPPTHNLLFLFTSASESNFKGLEEWLSNADTKILDSVEFALCLDTLSGPSLNFHISRPPKLPSGMRLAESLEAAASSNGVELKTHVKKIKLNDPAVPWQHERLARHKMASGTVSSLSVGSSVMQRGSVIDSELTMVDQESLIRNIKILAEGVVQHIYDTSAGGEKVFEGAFCPSRALVRSWHDFLVSRSRFFTLMKAKSLVGTQILKGMELYLEEVRRQPFAATAEPAIFYVDQPVEIYAMRAKVLGFHLLYLAVNLLYLALLYICVKGPRNISLTFFRGDSCAKIQSKTA